MACPTCDGTMENLGANYTDGHAQLFWCPRCGTIKLPLGIIEAPKLVGRCREYYQSAKIHMDLWNRLGINETLFLPDDRDKT